MREHMPAFPVVNHDAVAEHARHVATRDAVEARAENSVVDACAGDGGFRIAIGEFVIAIRAERSNFGLVQSHDALARMAEPERVGTRPR